MDKHDMQLHKVKVVSGADVVREHKTSKLVNVQVFVRKYKGVGLVSPINQASKNVSSDGDCNVA